MTKKSFLALVALVITGTIITSCNKQNQTYNTSFTEDHAYAEGIFNDISSIADEGYEKGASGLKSGDGAGLILSDCAEVTIDLSASPYQLIVDFGEENCLCNDGKNRRGKLIASFDGMYHKEGTTITHTLENFYVDDNKVEGTKTVVNKGLNANQNYQFDVEENAVITKTDESTITWNSARQREWLKGDSTLTVWDDVYSLTGTANGKTSTGETWEMEILKSLILELDCRWVPSGSIEINIESLPTGLLDYGDGSCDRLATLEVEGKVYTIYMK
jgi:hypothetical protein